MQKYKERRPEARETAGYQVLELLPISQQRKTGLPADLAKTKSTDTN